MRVIIATIFERNNLIIAFFLTGKTIARRKWNKVSESVLKYFNFSIQSKSYVGE